MRNKLCNTLAIAVFACAAMPALAQVTVPPGFTAQLITTGANLDVQPGQGGAFGLYVYYIDESASPNNIMRVDPAGGAATFFASVPGAITLGVGFGDDLFAAEGAFGATSGDVWRIKSDGTVSFFAPIPTFVEGMAFSSGSAFGNNLYVSEFGPNRIQSIDSNGVVTLFANLSAVSSTPTGLEFGPGGAFGSDLYVIDRFGAVFTVDASGTPTPFVVSPAIINGETLAFGGPASAFGEYLYVAEEGAGNLVRIDPTGTLTTFGSGFSFGTGGVTGLEFSADGNTLFVTADDPAGSLYAITREVVSVGVDIKPGSDPNSINLCSQGNVPVAVLGASAFEVLTVDTESLRFADAAVRVVGKKDPHQLCSYEDVNADSFDDLVCHFVTTDIAGIDGDSTTATLNGELLDGTAIEGTDSINIVKDTCN